MSREIKVAKSRDVKERLGLSVRAGKNKIALFRYQKKIYAYLDSCPHQAAPISTGSVDEGFIVCPHHRWKFGIEDGAFIGNPLIKIRCFPVREEDGYIFVTIEE